jgi:hypothetical protein
MIGTKEEQLEKLRRLEENWDSYHGQPITEEALRVAEMYFDFFVSIKTEPQLIPTSDGGVSIEWAQEGAVFWIEPEGSIISVSYYDMNNQGWEARYKEIEE